jgi:hypothetical protein
MIVPFLQVVIFCHPLDDDDDDDAEITGRI